jgi:hypothetical protein
LVVGDEAVVPGGHVTGHGWADEQSGLSGQTLKAKNGSLFVGQHWTMMDWPSSS